MPEQAARQRRLLDREIAEGDAPAAGGADGAAGGPLGQAGLLGDGVPGAAGIAAPGPFRVGRAAVVADEDRLAGHAERSLAFCITV